eukprot:GHVR01104190.1.p2 GENE.GHVR01104190.1~~GHVR01104190.1.p2  ORF type:complete len:139 (-),score=30.70 GHVR01104190.1:459-875(-)
MAEPADFAEAAREMERIVAVLAGQVTELVAATGAGLLTGCGQIMAAHPRTPELRKEFREWQGGGHVSYDRFRRDVFVAMMVPLMARACAKITVYAASLLVTPSGKLSPVGLGLLMRASLANGGKGMLDLLFAAQDFES